MPYAEANDDEVCKSGEVHSSGVFIRAKKRRFDEPLVGEL